MQYLGSSSKNNTMISVHFQGKPFNITIIQVYTSITNAKKAEVEQFYETTTSPSRTNSKKRYPFHYRGLKCKSRKSRDTWSNKEVWSTNEEGQRLTELCQENSLLIANTLFWQHQRRLYTWTSPDGQY